MSRWRADRDFSALPGRDDRGETWQLGLVGESRSNRDDGVQRMDVAVGLDWHFDAVDTEVLGGAGDGQATLGAESSQNGHEGLSVEELCE